MMNYYHHFVATVCHYKSVQTDKAIEVSKNDNKNLYISSIVI